MTYNKPTVILRGMLFRYSASYRRPGASEFNCEAISGHKQSDMRRYFDTPQILMLEYE